MEVGGTLADADALADTHSGEGSRVRGHVRWHLLAAAKRGDTMQQAPILAARIAQATGLPLATVRREMAAEGGAYVTLQSPEEVVADAEVWRTERRLADTILQRASQRFLSPLGPLESVTEEQAAALETACSAAIAVLTGGPGTGKSFAVRALVAALGEGRCMMTAPTGRAARNLRGSTVHSASGGRLLKRRPIQETTRADVPDDLLLLVVDEASMLSTELMVGVLNLAPPGCHVLLVGDPDQLPPIGAGNVLRDLIDSGRCPVARLTTNQRSVSSVQALAAAVLGGQADETSLQALMRCPTPGLVVRATVGAAVREGAQVLTPHNATRAQYNRALQSALLPGGVKVTWRLDSPPGPAVGEVGVMRTDEAGQTTIAFGSHTETFPVEDALTATRPMGGVGAEDLVAGDLVMVLKNQNKKRRGGEVSACNGDIGTLVRAPILGVKPVVDFGECGTSEFPTAKGWLTLGYAATVHKFQGSECDVVALPLDATWDRQLLYTAITRARTKAVLLGTPDRLRHVLGSRRPERLSLLRVLLSKGSKE